jgi:hypothetical protein
MSLRSRREVVVEVERLDVEQELGGPEHPAARPPSCERLDGDERAVTGSVDGLVVRRELAVAQRPFEHTAAVATGQVGDHGGVALWREDVGRQVLVSTVHRRT